MRISHDESFSEDSFRVSALKYITFKAVVNKPCGAVNTPLYMGRFDVSNNNFFYDTIYIYIHVDLFNKITYNINHRTKQYD